MKLPKLLTGTLIATIFLLLTNYLFYVVIQHGTSGDAAWGPRVLHTLIYALAFTYIIIKASSISNSKFTRGLMVGLAAGLLVISGAMIINLHTQATPLFLLDNGTLYNLLQNVALGLVMSATTSPDPCIGKTGSGGDD